MPTTRYVAFLRGINVGGQAVVKMTDLRDAFSAAGCGGVRTYIQSGNVVFDAPGKSLAPLARKVDAALRPLLGEEPVVIYRPADALARTLEHDPLKRVARQAEVKCYVTFMRHRPKIGVTLPLAFPKDGIEVVAVDELDLFVASRPNALGRYGFPNLPVEKHFGVPATSRNWNTLTKIVALARS